MGGKLPSIPLFDFVLGNHFRQAHPAIIASQLTSEGKVKIFELRMLGMSDCPLRTRRYVVDPSGSDETGGSVVST